MATAATASAITYIDGDAGVLLYRGYPIEQLAKHSSFLEVSYLLQKGELPSREELGEFTNSITRHTMLNEWILRLYRGFHHDAHPMAMVATIVASLAAFYHDSTDIYDDRHREIFSHRIDREAADHRGSGLQARAGPALHLPAQRPRLHGEHAAHVLRRALRGLRGRPPACEGARPAVHPARRPRAEREHLDGADRRQHRLQPVHGDVRGRLGAVGARARRCQRGRGRHARRRSATRATSRSS